MTRLLLIDDDRDLARLLKAYLGRQGYELDWADRPSTGVAKIAARPDLVLLDVMLPERDGFAVCKEIRANGDAVPIIMLPAKADAGERVLGLRTGADDYVAKPFEPLELLARIEAVLRRSGKQQGAPPPANGLDADRKVLCVSGREVPLTLSEFRMLEIMTATPGKLFTRDRLLDALDEVGSLEASDRAIDVHVSRLRLKIEPDPRQPRHMITVRGMGYRFEW